MAKQAPGVYISRGTPPPKEIAPTNTAAPCFIGLAERGPLNEVVQIGSWEQYNNVFGSSHRHYLAPSVEAFFRNGGKACYVIRVAHVKEDPEHEVAASAVLSVKDELGKPTLTIEASSPGVWGNELWASVERCAGAEALVTRDVEVGTSTAQLSSTRGFSVGDLIALKSGDKVDHVILSNVSDHEISWSADTPINHKHAASAPTYASVIHFDIEVALRDQKEAHRNLQLNPESPRYAPRVLQRQSRLARVVDHQSQSILPRNMPVATSMVKLTGGANGTDYLEPMDFIGIDNGPGQRTGIQLVRERDEIGMLACPDAMIFCERAQGPAGYANAQRVQDAMVDMCEATKYQFAILDIPQTKKIDEVKRWRNRVDSSYCAFYWPWLQMETSQGLRTMPPSGPMAGVFAKVELEQGVHQAPANVSIVGASDLALHVHEGHWHDLAERSINSFRYSKALGVRPWGVRSASTDPDWRHLTVRRLFIMLRRSVDYNFGWVPFEANTANTRKKLENSLNDFLGRLYQKGMFATGNPQDAFYVKCDDENNSADSIAEGRLYCQIGVAPAVPAEFILIDVEQEMLTG